MRLHKTLVLFSIALFSLPAQANLFEDVWNDIKHDGSKIWGEMSSIYSSAARAEKQFQKSAEYISKKSLKDTVHFMKEAGSEIEKAAEISANFLLHLDEVGHDCEKVLNSIGAKALAKSMPFPGPFREVSAVNSKDCELHYTTGFTCGILPYVSSFAKAIANGKAGAERMARYLSRAHDMKPCSKLNAMDRQICSVILGLGLSSVDAQQCIGNVVKDLFKNGSNKSIDKSIVNKICTATGEFTFSFAADRVIPSLTEKDNMKKLFKVVKLARTAFNTSAKIADSDRVKKICHKSSVRHATKERRHHRLFPIEKNPGSHILVLHHLSDPKCLHWNPHGNQVRIWNCGGWNTQKWSFHKDGRILSDQAGTNSCLTAKKGGLYSAHPCGNMNKPPKDSQNFSIHHGLIKNKSTGQCLLGEKDGAVYDRPCHSTFKRRWYVSLPKAGPLALKPQKGLHVFVGKDKPLCLDSFVRGRGRSQLGFATCEDKGSQKWTLHPNGKFTLTVKDRKGRTSTCVSANSHNRGKTVRSFSCKSSEIKKQTFEILAGGLIKYKESGNYCLTRYYNNGEQVFRPHLTTCNRNDDNQRWYMF